MDQRSKYKSQTGKNIFKRYGRNRITSLISKDSYNELEKYNQIMKQEKDRTRDTVQKKKYKWSKN